MMLCGAWRLAYAFALLARALAWQAVWELFRLGVLPASGGRRRCARQRSMGCSAVVSRRCLLVWCTGQANRARAASPSLRC